MTSWGAQALGTAAAASAALAVRIPGGSHYSSLPAGLLAPQSFRMLLALAALPSRTILQCHTHTQLDLTPHVNLITGTNGSGKSGVLQALQLCLGAKPSVLGR